MSLFQRLQRPRTPLPREDHIQHPQGVAIPEPVAVRAQEENAILELRKQEEQAAEHRRQAARDQELAALNARVDSILSANSDVFLQNLEQPGGQ